MLKPGPELGIVAQGLRTGEGLAGIQGEGSKAKVLRRVSPRPRFLGGVSAGTAELCTSPWRAAPSRPSESPAQRPDWERRGAQLRAAAHGGGPHRPPMPRDFKPENPLQPNPRVRSPSPPPDTPCLSDSCVHYAEPGRQSVQRQVRLRRGRLPLPVCEDVMAEAVGLLDVGTAQLPR